MCSTKQTKRNGYTIQVSEEVLDGDFCFHPPSFLTFPSFDDYQKVINIEELMYKLYNIKNIRKDEEKFYKHLKKIENIIKDCVPMKLRTNYEESFHLGFPNITNFIYEARYAEFKHNNKRLERSLIRLLKQCGIKG